MVIAPQALLLAVEAFVPDEEQFAVSDAALLACLHSIIETSAKSLAGHGLLTTAAQLDLGAARAFVRERKYAAALRLVRCALANQSAA